MTRLLGNVMLLTLTLVVMAGVFELVCRTVLNNGTQYHIEMWKYAAQLKRVSANKDIGHEHVPGSHAHLMNVDVVINSQGLRDDEIDVQKPADTMRVLMLGDSITFGWGVADGETMSAVLENVFEQNSPQPVQVINTGVGNYNTTMEVAYFLERGKSFNPDVVVLNYFINDAEPTPVYEDVSWFAKHSFAYAVIGGAWDGLRRRVLGEADWRSYYSGLYNENAEGWHRTKESLAKLAEYCRSHDVRLVVANIPELRELNPYPFSNITRKIETVVREAGAEFVDLKPAVDGVIPSALWVTEPDPHPNGRAQNLMGRYLAAYLLKTKTEHVD